MGAILKLQKRKHPKVTIDPYTEGGESCFGLFFPSLFRTSRLAFLS